MVIVQYSKGGESGLMSNLCAECISSWIASSGTWYTALATRYWAMDRQYGDLGKLDSLPSSKLWYQKSPISR
jgi:hypothetical protein